MSDVRQLLENARERSRAARRYAAQARTVDEESDWTHEAAIWGARVIAYEVELGTGNPERSGPR